MPLTRVDDGTFVPHTLSFEGRGPRGAGRVQVSFRMLGPCGTPVANVTSFQVELDRVLDSGCTAVGSATNRVNVVTVMVMIAALLAAHGLLVPADPASAEDHLRVDRNGLLTGRTNQPIPVPATSAAVFGDRDTAEAPPTGFLERSVASGTLMVADLPEDFTSSYDDPVALPLDDVAGSDRGLAGPRNGKYNNVVYVGDSMAHETKADLRAFLPGWGFHDLTYGGTAPCDWISRAQDAANRVRPDFVVVSFLGNNLTECTDGATGDALVDQYSRDITTICQQAAPAVCVLVGQAVLASLPSSPLPEGEPTEIYRSMAAQHSWSFVDAGAAVEDDGRFVPSLRSTDLVHFSPEGAALYAIAIANFLEAATAQVPPLTPGAR